MRELLVACGSLRARRGQAEVPFQEAVEAFHAYQEGAGAFACPEGEGAFWEGSSSSRMRGKVESCSPSAPHCA